MTVLLAIPCCVMNLARRSDAEDSNTLEITGFGALILFIADCRFIEFSGALKTLTIGNWQSAMSGFSCANCITGAR